MNILNLFKKKKPVAPEKSFLDEMQKITLVDYLGERSIFFIHPSGWFRLDATPDQIIGNLSELHKKNNITRNIDLTKKNDGSFKDPLSFLAFIVNNDDKWITEMETK